MPNYDFRILGDCQKDKKRQGKTRVVPKLRRCGTAVKIWDIVLLLLLLLFLVMFQQEEKKTAGNEEEQVLDPSLSSFEHKTEREGKKGKKQFLNSPK